MDDRDLYDRENRIGAMFRPSRAAWWYLSFMAAWRHMRSRRNLDATAYISHVMRKRWFTAEFPEEKPVTVRLVPGYSWCAPQKERVIHLGSTSRRTLQAMEWDLLHELAHILSLAPEGQSPAACPEDAGQRHGDTWKTCYIFLIRNVIGNRAAKQLCAAIKPPGCG